MPSPIAHAAMGYLLYEAYRPIMPEEASRYVGPIPRLLIATVGLSMLADLDFLPGILFGDPSRFHNSFSNSATICLAVALAEGEKDLLDEFSLLETSPRQVGPVAPSWTVSSWPPPRRGSSGDTTYGSEICPSHNSKVPNAAGTLGASRRRLADPLEIRLEHPHP